MRHPEPPPTTAADVAGAVGELLFFLASKALIALLYVALACFILYGVLRDFGLL
jgi:hypothetical protein